MFDIIKQEIEEAHRIGLVAGFKMGMMIGMLVGVFLYLLAYMAVRSLT